jgi:hypothetical protein
VRDSSLQSQFFWESQKNPSLQTGAVEGGECVCEPLLLPQGLLRISYGHMGDLGGDFIFQLLSSHLESKANHLHDRAL